MLESVLFVAFIVIFALICWWSLWDQKRQLRRDSQRQEKLYASYR